MKGGKANEQEKKKKPPLHEERILNVAELKKL